MLRKCRKWKETSKSRSSGLFKNFRLSRIYKRIQIGEKILRTYLNYKTPGTETLKIYFRKNFRKEF